MGLGKAEIQKLKESEKEKKERQQAEIREIVAEIRELMRQERGTSEDIAEWAEFERALTGFLSGDVKGNAAAMSIALLNNIKSFTKGKKSFIESAKGQQVAEKLHKEMSRVPGAMEDPQARPLIKFLGHVAAGEAKHEEAEQISKISKKEARKIAEQEGWVFVDDAPGPKNITVEEGKEDQEEAMEELRKFHESLGLKSPEEIKKEQQGITKGM